MKNLESVEKCVWVNLWQRRTRYLSAALLLLLGLGWTPRPEWTGLSAAAQSGGSTTAAADKIVVLTNQIRAKNGLAPLSPLPAMHTAALTHSEEMLELDYFSHNSPVTGKVGDRLKRVGARWTACAENIYRSTGFALSDVAAETVDAWVNSPGHYKNIISTNYTHIGVGVVYQNDQAVVTQVFARL